MRIGTVSAVDKISIHAPREGSDAALSPTDPGGTGISIHAPREGSDAPSASRPSGDFIISIHAPREGSDFGYIVVFSGFQRFLSTLPARGATFSWSKSGAKSKFLSTLPARGATDYNPNKVSEDNLFLSTLPARGATALCGGPCVLAR